MEQSVWDPDSSMVGQRRAPPDGKRFQRVSPSRKELRTALDIDSNTLHEYIDALVDVSLAENRRRKEPTSDGLHSYYRATSLGVGILEYGVHELMREEWELPDAYVE